VALHVDDPTHETREITPPPGTTMDEHARPVAVEREERELRRANEILKAAAFFAAELDRPVSR